MLAAPLVRLLISNIAPLPLTSILLTLLLSIDTAAVVDVEDGFVNMEDTG